MRYEGHEQFDDPELKACVKKAFGGEFAPISLRKKVAAIQAELHRADRFKISFSNYNPIYALTAAAILFLAVGMAFSNYLSTQTYTPVAAAPNDGISISIFKAMMTKHDHSADADRIHGDVTTARMNLQSSVDQPVLAENIGEGWTFRSAGVVYLANNPTAQVVFTRGDQTLSIFSMPLMVNEEAYGDGVYESTIADHPVTGFVTSSGVYFLVGSDPTGKLTLTELCALRDKIRESSAEFARPQLDFPQGIN
jgi:hypothetical protein